MLNSNSSLHVYSWNPAVKILAAYICMIWHGFAHRYFWVSSVDFVWISQCLCHSDVRTMSECKWNSHIQFLHEISFIFIPNNHIPLFFHNQALYFVLRACSTDWRCYCEGFGAKMTLPMTIPLSLVLNTVAW